MDTALNRVAHHLGNGAQILCFVKNPTPEIVRAGNLVKEALAIVKKVNDGRDKIFQLLDDPESTGNDAKEET